MLHRAVRYRNCALVKATLLLVVAPLILYADSFSPPLAHTGALESQRAGRATPAEDPARSPSGSQKPIRQVQLFPFLLLSRAATRVGTIGASSFRRASKTEPRRATLRVA